MFPFPASELRSFVACSCQLQRSCNAPGLPGRCCAPVKLTDTATAASWPLQRSGNAPGRCNCCFLALQRSCDAFGRCNCCFLASETLLQRSRTLQPLLPDLCCAPATFPDAAPKRARTLQLLLLGLQHARATLQDAATVAAFGAIARSCNAPRRCNCAATVASRVTECAC